MCAKNMEVHVQHGTQRTKGIKTGREIGLPRAKKGAKKLVSSDFAKILEKECSN